MLRVRPFAALRPDPNHAAQVASVPYDVVDADEARTLAAGNSMSFLHVVRPEIDLPPNTPPHDDRVYATARANLDRLVSEGVLVRDPIPRIYLYRQVLNHQSQIGVVCCCHVDDYLSDVIRKHELTRKEKEDDRTRHVLETGAHTGPVFLTYRDQPSIDALVAEDRNSRPLYHFNAPDGVTHTVWTTDRPEAYVAAFGSVPAAYVADGHHRAASAARAAEARRAAGAAGDEHDWFLAALFPAGGLHILPYHRLIRDLGGLAPEAVLDQLRTCGTLHPVGVAQPDRAGSFGIYLGEAAGGWHRLELDPATIDDDDPVGSLDVALLQERVLEPVFGIGDIRTDPRVDFVGGIRGTDALAAAVDAGRAGAAIAMYATTIEQLMRVSDAGLLMPPKSTWFEPKLRSGLLVHELGERDRGTKGPKG